MISGAALAVTAVAHAQAAPAADADLEVGATSVSGAAPAVVATSSTSTPPAQGSPIKDSDHAVGTAGAMPPTQASTVAPSSAQQPSAAQTGSGVAVAQTAGPSTAENVNPPAASTKSDAAGSGKDSPLSQVLNGVKVSGYFQAQYESHQDSEDQLNQSLGLLNQDRFSLRRGRVIIARDWDYASVLVEMDGNTSKGPAFRLQKAEASLLYGRSEDKSAWPLVQFTMGQFYLPFGYEILESSKTRAFMERTTGGRALWPSEADVGARLSGQVRFLRYAVSFTNGEPIDEKSGFGLQDPNKNKDVTVRLGAITKPWKGVTAAGDISYNAGKGFHSGTAATKSTVSWADAGNPGRVDLAEFSAIAGTSATPSQNFERWALGADAQLMFDTALGKSVVYGEVVIAQNLDRGLFVSDAIASGKTRQLSYYVALVQEVTPYGLVGFRTDFYDPNTDFMETRQGHLLPVSQSIRNYSPVIGLVLPERARLLFEYDIQRNLLGRDSRGVPAHLPNNTMTLRLQVNL